MNLKKITPRCKKIAWGGGIRVQAQIGEIIQGFPLFLGFLTHFLMDSGSTSSKELKNAIKSGDLPLLRALAAKLIFFLPTHTFFSPTLVFQTKNLFQTQNFFGPKNFFKHDIFFDQKIF